MWSGIISLEGRELIMGTINKQQQKLVQVVIYNKPIKEKNGFIKLHNPKGYRTIVAVFWKEPRPAWQHTFGWHTLDSHSFPAHMGGLRGVEVWGHRW